MLAASLLLLLSVANCHVLNDTELHNKFDELKHKFLDEDGNPVLLKRHLGETLALTLRSKLSEEERYEIFANHSDYIEQHNKEANKEWTAGYNEFSFLTKEEASHFMGLNSSSFDDMMDSEYPEVKRRAKVSLARRADDSSDFAVDYTDKLPPAKYQGNCGSCWAFAAIASLEYQVNKDKNEDDLIALSDQHALDCAATNGCDGSSTKKVYNWLQDPDQNSDLAVEDDYPYEYRVLSCPAQSNYRNGLEGFKMWGGYKLATGDAAMEAALADPQIGALIVTIAVVDSFLSYESGVYYDTDCPTIDHAVTAVGYGITGGIPYFLIRNSWGSNWGDGGNIKMRRGLDGANLNTCKLSSWAAYPLVYPDGAEDEIAFCEYADQSVGGSKVYYQGSNLFTSLEAAKEACILTEDCSAIQLQHSNGKYSIKASRWLWPNSNYAAYTLCGGWTNRQAQLEGK